ncbi:MAG: 5-methyltetrahydropteroyltriglutamate--homocysteine methyltransferase, partial [Candidatus Altarchaeum sp. CG_4_8_14_3_um_filter_33_2054]
EILANFAKSVGKFVKNAIIDKKFVKTKVIAIDEPSAGLNPNMIANDDDLINGWNIAIGAAKKNNIDAQIHLHSINRADTVLKSDIDVIDADVENLKDKYSLQKKDLERYDKFIRAGISKSNVFDIVEDYKKIYNIDPWQTREYDKIFEVETEKVISGRLNKSYEIYGEKIKYAGPTCGLGSWPTQESASKLLRYSSNAVHRDEF